MRNITSPAIRNWMQCWSVRGPFAVGPDAGFGGTYLVYLRTVAFVDNARFVVRSKGQAVAVCAALNWYEAFDEAKQSESAGEEPHGPEFRERGRSSG